MNGLITPLICLLKESTDILEMHCTAAGHNKDVCRCGLFFKKVDNFWAGVAGENK